MSEARTIITWLFLQSCSGMSTCFLGLLSKHFSELLLYRWQWASPHHLTYLKPLLGLDPQIDAVQLKSAESEIKDSHHGFKMRMEMYNVISDLQSHYMHRNVSSWPRCHPTAMRHKYLHRSCFSVTIDSEKPFCRTDCSDGVETVYRSLEE